MNGFDFEEYDYRCNYCGKGYYAEIGPGIQTCYHCGYSVD